MKSIDIAGKKFNKLTAVKFVEKKNGYNYYWLFRCDCGVEKILNKGHVSAGKIKSCGCIRSIPTMKNGKSYYNSSTYIVWRNILSRCKNIKNPNYINYGGRGIEVDEKWLKFENFLKDMGEKPKKLSIDRIDNNGNYCKENCKWSTVKEQARNRRSNVVVNYNGDEILLCELSESINISSATIKNRLSLGLDIKKRVSRKYSSGKINLEKFIFSNDKVLDIKNLRNLGCTLQQIGNIYGRSRERIRQILANSEE